MKKTYWWRMLVLFFSGMILFAAWIYDAFICVSVRSNCPLSQFRFSVMKPLVFFSIFVFFTSIFTLFIRDAVFIKWLKFAAVWLVFSMVLISATSTSVHSFSPLAGPDRESISIWMGLLFVIISLVQIILTSRKLKKS